MINLFDLFISLFATTLGAISGIGGGIIIKPLYDAFSGLEVSTINFMSGCMVLSMSIVSLIKSRNSKIKIDKFKSTILAIGAAVGGIIGKKLFEDVKNHINNLNFISSIQAFILIIMTLYVFWFVKHKNNITMKNIKNILIAILIGFSLGMISSFLGIGGGPINIAVLTYFFNMDSKTTSLNSIYIIFFSQITNLITTLTTHTIPNYNLSSLLLMIVGGIGGGFIGSSLVKKLSNKQVDKIFLYLLSIILIICIYNFIRFTFI